MDTAWQNAPTYFALIVALCVCYFWIIRPDSMLPTPIHRFGLRNFVIQPEKVSGQSKPTWTGTLESLHVAEAICSVEMCRNDKKKLFKHLLRPLRHLSVAFIGDSRIRDLFDYIRSLLRGWPFKPIQYYHNDIYVNRLRNLTLSFYWCPFPDLALIRLASPWKFETMDPPQYAVLQFGAWSVLKFGGSDQSRLKFSREIQAAAKLFGDFRNKTTAIWMKTLPGNPFTERLDSWVKYENRSDAIDQFAEELARLINVQKQLVWTTAHDTAKRNLSLYRDHIHPGTLLIQQFACQLLTSFSSRTSRQEMIPTGIKQLTAFSAYSDATDPVM